MKNKYYNPEFRLKSIRLKNIYSFRNVEFKNLNQFSILIGKNNSGKSNLFRCLKNFKIYGKHNQNFFFKNSDPEVAEIEFRFSLSRNLIKSMIPKNHITNQGNNRRFFFPKLNRIGSPIENQEFDITKSLQNFVIQFKFRKDRYSYLNFFGFKKLDENNSQKVYSLNLVNMDSDIAKLGFYQSTHNSNHYSLNFDFTQKTRISGFTSFDEFLERGNQLSELTGIPIRIYVYFLKFIQNIVYISDYRNFHFYQDISTEFAKMNQDGSNFPQKLFEFYNIKRKQNKIMELDTLLKKFYPSVEELGQDLSSQSIKPFIIEEESKELRSFDLIGRGIHNLVIILTHLLEANPESLVLIEEPESNLHAKLQKMIINTFSDVLPQSQFMITTHSSFILTEIDEYTRVFNIQKEKGVTYVNSIKYQDFANLFSDLGITPADLLAFERLIFVEGKSDRETIFTWMKILGYNPREKHVGIIELGGIKNYTHYATASTLKFLQDQGVKLWFFMDRDEYEEEEIANLEKRLSEFSNSSLFILKKRELENYFIKDALIQKYLKKYMDEAVFEREFALVNDEEIPSSIGKKISMISENFVDFVAAKYLLKKFSKPFYVDQRKLFKNFDSTIFEKELLLSFKKIKSHVEERIELLPSIFSSSKDKYIVEYQTNPTKFIDLIPGSSLLKKILNEYGLGYDKGKDALRFAELMEKEEIQDDIKEFFMEVFG